jgi:hypothetical protein
VDHRFVRLPGGVPQVRQMVVERGLAVSLVGVAWALAVISMPLAIGVAVLRYRLNEIDRIINRTLVYGLLTLFLGLCYWLSVLILQQLLRPLTQGSDLAVIGSTLAVAALFSLCGIASKSSR